MIQFARMNSMVIRGGFLNLFTTKLHIRTNQLVSRSLGFDTVKTQKENKACWKDSKCPKKTKCESRTMP